MKDEMRGQMHVYFASCVVDGGIYHYRMLPDGQLVFIDRTVCDRPMYMIQEDSQLHAVLREPFGDCADSGLISWEIAADGRLGKASEIVSTKGLCGCHLCRFKGKQYAVNYLSGSVFCSDGTLRTHTGSGPDPYRQETAHTHFISPSPDGKYLLVTDLGLDQIMVYDENLDLTGMAALPPGSGPRHLVSDCNHVFCVNELGCSVTMFDYDDGRLTERQTIPVLPAGYPADTTCAAIRRRGNKLYVSNRGDNSISILEYDSSGIQLLSAISCGGDSPRDIFLLGEYLLCANQRSSSVSVFRVAADGLVPVSGGETVVIPEVLGICGWWFGADV